MSAYSKRRQEQCPEGCGKGLPMSKIFQSKHVDEEALAHYACTAIDPEEEIERLQKALDSQDKHWAERCAVAIQLRDSADFLRREKEQENTDLRAQLEASRNRAQRLDEANARLQGQLKQAEKERDEERARLDWMDCNAGWPQ